MSDTALLHRKPTLPRPVTEVGAGAPEPELCQVGGLVPGIKGGWCLVRPIPYCPLGFYYGDGYLCCHPEVHRIIARTRAQQAARRARMEEPSPHQA